MLFLATGGEKRADFVARQINAIITTTFRKIRAFPLLFAIVAVAYETLMDGSSTSLTVNPVSTQSSGYLTLSTASPLPAVRYVTASSPSLA